MYNFTIIKPKTLIMRRLALVFCVLCMAMQFSWAQKVLLSLNSEKANIFNVQQSSLTGFDFTAHMNDLVLFEVGTKAGQFYAMISEGMIMDGVVGDPSLPCIKKLVEMPVNGIPEIEVLSYEEDFIDLNLYGIIYPVLPQQPSLSKSQDADEVPFYYNQAKYGDDNFSDVPVAKIERLGEMRGVNIGRLTISPVQYNPVTNQFRILKNVRVRVTYRNADVQKTIQNKKQHYSPAFEMSFGNIQNYQPAILKDTLTKFPVKYLIISDRMFEADLQTFVEWKTRKGFNVVVAYTDVIGTTTTAIKNYIATQYNAGTPTNPAPSYVLFVGDVAQVPTFNGTTGSHVTDLYYVEINGGTDYFPEMYFGRFSAQTVAQMQTLKSKTLQFEQYTMPDPAYLDKALLVAGVDASMAPTYGNGQINYGTSNYFNAAHDISTYVYLYGSGSPIISNSTAASPAIRQNVSDGVGFANYTAHCSEDGWADPSFIRSHVPALTNVNKYCVMIGNCCLSNKFEVSECFGEAITRTPEKGAVAYIGASNSSYWNEDYYYSVGVGAITATPTYATTGLGYYDKLFHENGEAFSDWYVSTGQMNFGGNLAVSEGSTSDKYYWEMYQIMGDPSLMPYLGIPSALTANYLTTIPIGVPTVVINTEEHAYVALSLNNVLKEAQYTMTNTSVTMDLSFVAAPCTLDVVITKQDRIPHMGQIVIVPNNSPYVVYSNHTVNDPAGNNNSIVDYSENIVLDLTLSNVGNQDASNVTATLSSTDANINITDNTETFGTITASNSLTMPLSYAFAVNAIIPDQHSVPFVISSSNGTDTWNTNFNIVLNAPLITVPSVIVDDTNTGNSNNRLDPGENVTLNFNTLNGGHSISPAAIGTMTCASPYITITNATANLGALGISQTIPASYDIQIDASTPLGTMVTFNYSVDAGGYTAVKSITLPVGLIVEDWETNTFSHFPWSTTDYGTVPWIITSAGSIYEGGFAARSGDINDNQTSVMNIQVTVLNADTLSFFKKVSCEAISSYGSYWDYLEFLVDGTSKAKWAGEVDWSRQAYYVTAGSHLLTWKYFKDGSVSSGSDAAWVDFIVFPPIDLSADVDNNLIVAQSLSVYPNPFLNEFSVNIGLALDTKVTIEMFNSLGQKVKTIASDLQLSQGYNNISVSTLDLPAGFYIIKYNSPYGELNSQVVKTN
ncbi:MAG: hypothetical protein CVU05_08390 [Bacteroidetes bacterium HGW-Bacteroidetes-21]|nr:MAG: hypothetical protein CVU05_08390 [Bacteroidetes bacterium HGW-Bacteroidetes-21]